VEKSMTEDELARVLREGNFVTLDIGKCPRLIIAPEHYRPDGTCRCNDPDDPHMAEWGYIWDRETKQWVGAD
jgi:hypothetical protein